MSWTSGEREGEKKRWKVFQQVKHYCKRGKQILRIEEEEEEEECGARERELKENVRWMESKNAQIILAVLASVKVKNKQRGREDRICFERRWK